MKKEGKKVTSLKKYQQPWLQGPGISGSLFKEGGKIPIARNGGS
jgi:hypothetical protein